MTELMEKGHDVISLLQLLSHLSKLWGERLNAGLSLSESLTVCAEFHKC